MTRKEEVDSFIYYFNKYLCIYYLLGNVLSKGLRIQVLFPSTLQFNLGISQMNTE